MEEAALVIAAMGLVAWMMWLVFRGHQFRHQAELKRAECLQALLEKFSTSAEFLEFLSSPNGQKVLSTPALKTLNPRKSVLRFLQSGVVLIAIGAGFLLNAFLLRHETDINYVRKMLDLNYWGTFSCALGIGLLIVAGISQYLAAQWGLFREQ